MLTRKPRPSFGPACFQRLKGDTLPLRNKADSTEAFHHPAIEAVHGDLHEGNVIARPPGRSCGLGQSV
jgi:hypothetical protein